MCGNRVLAQRTPQCLTPLPRYWSSTFPSPDEYNESYTLSFSLVLLVDISVCMHIHFYPSAFFVLLYCSTLTCIFLILPRPSMVLVLYHDCAPRTMQRKKKISLFCRKRSSVSPLKNPPNQQANQTPKASPLTFFTQELSGFFPVHLVFSLMI